eukprot:4410274-Lingulodinium_polyedra.AAC.1
MPPEVATRTLAAKPFSNETCVEFAPIPCKVGANNSRIAGGRSGWRRARAQPTGKACPTNFASSVA